MESNEPQAAKASIEANQPRIERIGLLLVHGIGDQNRTEHLQSVAGNLVRIASLVYGREKVSIQMFPGLGGWSDLSIIIKFEEDLLKVIDFHEVWWRDLGQKNTPFNIARFWLWAATFSGTRGRFFQDNKVTMAPKSKAVEKNRILFSDRLLLFIKITYFFIMLFPLRLFVQLANFIPGIHKVNLFGTVFNYMSSVQMYQQRQGAKGGTLVDYNQSRRISIQRRFANAVIDMAERPYDRWYIIAHSLGSVIAFKGLMCPDDAFANFISMDRWQHKNMCFRTTIAEPDEYPDKPRRPLWLQEHSGLDADAIFQRCAGLVTWGSPLETFARTWPGMVHFKRNAKFSDEFEWINLYDCVDIISSPLPSFKDHSFPIQPQDVSCASSNWVFSAHTSYFKSPRAFVRSSVGTAILDWIIVGNEPFEELCNRKGIKQVVGFSVFMRRCGTAVQFLVALLVGLFVWPVSLALLLRIVFLLPEEVLRFIGVAVEQYDADADPTSSFVHRLIVDYRHFTDTVIQSISSLQPTLSVEDDIYKFVKIFVIVFFCIVIGGLVHNLRDWAKFMYNNKHVTAVNKEMALAQFPDERPT